MKYERIREKVLEKYYPEEEETQKAKKLYDQISEFIQQRYGLDTHFAGSAGRGTCLSDDKDVDVFVTFPEDRGREELEKKGLEIGKEVFRQFSGDHQVEYAEHPYTKGEMNGHEVEVVPCYDVPADRIKSAVDRTPHHSNWVRENLDEEQREDVVMLKSFLKVAGLYGSSLKTRGFSGYLCESLIGHYGRFRELVESASEWKENEVIDPENHHNGNLPGELENKFSDDLLVLIDPVDPERNVASVMSEENYAKFVHLCWRFAEIPGMDFFTVKEKEVTEFEVKQELEKRGDLTVMEFDRPNGVEDIIYPQMRKFQRRIEDIMSNSGFRVFKAGFHIGEEKTRFILELDDTLPGVEYIKGPKVFHNVEHLEQFSSKYDNTFVQRKRLFAKTEREFTTARERLERFLDGDLESKGVPGDVAEALEKWKFSGALDGGEAWLNFLAEWLNMEEDQ